MLKTVAGPELALCVGLVYDLPEKTAQPLINAKEPAARVTKRKVSNQARD
jgi:hypothetical protein